MRALAVASTPRNVDAALLGERRRCARRVHRASRELPRVGWRSRALQRKAGDNRSHARARRTRLQIHASYTVPRSFSAALPFLSFCMLVVSERRRQSAHLPPPPPRSPLRSSTRSRTSRKRASAQRRYAAADAPPSVVVVECARSTRRRLAGVARLVHRHHVRVARRVLHRRVHEQPRARAARALHALAAAAAVGVERARAHGNEPRANGPRAACRRERAAHEQHDRGERCRQPCDGAAAASSCTPSTRRAHGGRCRPSSTRAAAACRARAISTTSRASSSQWPRSCS